ncbi:MAG: hypothetical protein ABI700_31675, partial [Chloroflexota bacterium]
MKRFISSCVVLLLALTACGQATPTPQIPNTEAPLVLEVTAAQNQEATATEIQSTAIPVFPVATQTQGTTAEQTQEATAAQTQSAVAEQTLEATAAQTQTVGGDQVAGAKTPTQICASAVPAADPPSRSFSQPQQVVEPSVDYRAVICTDVGPVYVDLLENY